MKASVLLILLICCHANPTRYTYADNPPSFAIAAANRQPGGEQPGGRNLRSEILRAPDNTYGYRIYRHGRLYVDQPHRPALPGNSGFATKEDAGKVADLVIMKIRKGEAPPTVSREELMRLGVVE